MQREFTVNKTCDNIVLAIRQELDAAGFRVEQSFDLRSVLALVPNCTCPHHGTALCDCQYNVLLLIYGRASTPATLVVHGHDNQCRIALAEDPSGRETTALAAEIIHTLAVVRLIATHGAGDAAPHTALSCFKRGVLLSEVVLAEGLAVVVYDPDVVTLSALLQAVADASNDGRHHYAACILAQTPAREALRAL